MAEPSVLTRQPQNTNPLQTTKYVFVMPRISNVQYFCQEAQLPGISLSELSRVTPVVDIYSPGNKITYDKLSLTFLVDADLKSWKDIRDWMYDLTQPTGDAKGYKNLWAKDTVLSDKQMAQYADGILTIYSALNNPKIRISYKNLFPVDLTSIDFNSKGSAEDILTATVTFRYDYYDIEYIGA
jgi:T4-like virus tail tube protein gp19